MSFVLNCVFAGILLVAFGYMLIFVVATNILIRKYENYQDNVQVSITGKIDDALKKIETSNMLKTYTLAVKGSNALGTAIKTKMAASTILRTSGLNVHLENMDYGNIVLASSVVGGFDPQKVEYLVFKDLGAGRDFYDLYASGAVLYIVMGGRTFIMLPWATSGIISDIKSDTTSDLNADVVIPIVAMLPENLISLPANYALQDSILDSSTTVRSLSDMLATKSANGYSTVCALAY